MTNFLPIDMLKSLRLDDFNAQADQQQSDFDQNTAPPPPQPQPFKLPSWGDIQLGAQQAAQGFKLPDWSNFQLGGPSNQDQIKQSSGAAGAAAMPSWDSLKFGSGDNSTGAASPPDTQPAGAGPSSPSAPSGGAPAPQGDLVEYARGAAQRAGIDPDIFVRQINQESGFNPQAGSPAGAQGIAQFMPATAAGVGLTNVWDPYASLDAAARLMRSNLNQYNGDYRKALQAYNAGPGNVDSGAADTFDETNTYVRNILQGKTPTAPATAPVQQSAMLDLSNQQDSPPVVEPIPNAQATVDPPTPEPIPNASTLQPIDFRSSMTPMRQQNDLPVADSTYGPFDPPGYRQPPSVTPADQTLDPTGTGPQPGDFPATSPAAPTYYPTTQQDLPPNQPEGIGGAILGGLQRVGQGIGDFSNGLAGGLNRASDALTGGLNRGADQLATDPNTGQTYSGGEGLLQAGHNIARVIGDSPAIGAADANASWDRMAEIDKFATDNGYYSAIDPRFIKDYPDLATEHGQMVMGVAGGMAGNAPELHGATPAHLGGVGAAPLPNPIRKAGEVIGGLRDLAGDMTRGLPGGAPVLSAVGDGQAGAPRTIQTPEQAHALPVAGDAVGGLRVGEHVANTDSIGSTINDYEVVPGLRAVPMDVFGSADAPLATDRRTIDLAERIRQSGRIDPLIVAIDADGPYILEGGHRYEALRTLGVKEFPAQVVISHDAPPPVGVTTPRATAADAVGALVAENKGGYWEVTTHDGKFVSNVYESVAPTAEQAVAEAQRRLSARSAPDPTLAAEADRLSTGQQGQGAPGLGVVPSDRYYHGTGSAFDTPNPAKFDDGGLFGPAYYLTDNPEVSGTGDTSRPGYAEARGRQGIWTPDNRWLADNVTDLSNKLEAAQARLQEPVVPLAERRLKERQIHDYSEALARTGSNVRAVDVPQGLNLLDVDAPVAADDLRRIATAAPSDSQLTQLVPRWEQSGAIDHIDGNTVWKTLSRDLGPRDANQVLAAAGYDGVKYAGGRRVPMRDETGAPIEHQVVAIFGDSLDKITNATSGLKGGIVAFDPSGALAGIGQGAVGGGIAGGYDESQQENPNGMDIAKGIVGGMIMGGAARGLGRSKGTRQAIANVVKATNLSDPNNQKLGAMFEKPVPTPATTTPWYRRLAEKFTDDRALLNGWEKDVRARLGPNAPATDLIGDLVRINPDSVAAQRLKPIEEAAGMVRDAGVDPSVLSLYLAHTHDIDIADSFGMRAWDAATARGATPAQAQLAYDRAANGRTFSGDRHVPDIQASLQSMASDLSQDQMQAVKDAAQKIWDLNGETRDRLFAAGGMDAATHADLSVRYPHYVTTDIVNHIDPESAVAGAGGGVSQRTNAIRELSAAGTASDRLDPLQSVVANTVRSERWIAKNTVFQAFHELVNSDPALATQLGVTPSKPGGTKEVTGLVNGQRETLRVARPIAEVIEMGSNTALGILGEVFRKLTGPFKAALTTYNPAFQYVVNPLRDSSDFFTRQSAYLGGPQHLPEVMAAYAAAVKDVATEGKWTQAYKAAGGAYERLDTSAKGVANLTKDLTTSGGEQIRDPRRIASIARDVLTLGARPVGEKIEMVPRVAAFKMAAERGASPVESMIAGRNSTVPFEVGGRWVKAANTAIPFMNATMQAGAQLGRSFRDHPVATTASMATIVGLPALAAQAWNRSDPDRAAAYADVPDYLKRNGLVFMLPLAGSDQRGKLPNYLWIPLGNFAPAATAMNAAVEAKMGESSPDEFGKLLMGVLGSFSPIKGDSVGSALSGVIPPGISTARDLMANRDNFRGRTIASDAADRNAGALAKGITGGLQAIGEHVPPVAGLRDIRPSQTEYVIRDLAGSPGQTASAAANMVAGQESGRNRPVQDVPIVGGLAGRVIRDTGGQQLQNAQDSRISPDVDAALRDAGLRPNDVVAPVMASASGVPLDREQQLAYQTFMNGYLDREITNAMRTAEYRNPATREQALRDAISTARQAAAARVLARVPAAQQELLRRQDALRKAG